MNIPELYRIITGDGQIYDLFQHSRRYILSSPNGMGMSGVSYSTIQFYKQHGVTETNYTLEPRQFSIGIGSENSTREALFEARRDLLNAIRPNRNGQLTFVFRYANSPTEYAIKARVSDLAFNSFSPDEYNEHRFSEQVLLTAFDPTWYAYAASTVAATSASDSQLVFPISFGSGRITFGDSDLFARATINYNGTWFAYPVITCTGPFNNLEITHDELQYKIAWMGTINTGQTLTFDLRNSYDTQGNPTGVRIYNNSNVSQFNYLSPITDLLNFAVYPEGMVTGGVNNLSFSALGTNPAQTAFSVSYNTRFIGI